VSLPQSFRRLPYVLRIYLPCSRIPWYSYADAATNLLQHVQLQRGCEGSIYRASLTAFDVPQTTASHYKNNELARGNNAAASLKNEHFYLALNSMLRVQLNARCATYLAGHAMTT
jgi:hypothetical protein